MANADSVKAKIERLISEINEVTEISDTNLTDAIAHLIEKYNEGGAFDPYTGSYEVTPKTTAQTLPTANKIMTSDLTVKGIPVTEETNASGGTTVTIGGV